MTMNVLSILSLHLIEMTKKILNMKLDSDVALKMIVVPTGTESIFVSWNKIRLNN